MITVVKGVSRECSLISCMCK